MIWKMFLWSLFALLIVWIVIVVVGVIGYWMYVKHDSEGMNGRH